MGIVKILKYVIPCIFAVYGIQTMTMLIDIIEYGGTPAQVWQIVFVYVACMVFSIDCWEEYKHA